MINGDHVLNFFLFLAGIAMFAIILLVSMRAIDKMAERDCARGITSACQYVPKAE